jgi:hypothetical protein
MTTADETARVIPISRRRAIALGGCFPRRDALHRLRVESVCSALGRAAA